MIDSDILDSGVQNSDVFTEHRDQTIPESSQLIESSGSTSDELISSAAETNISPSPTTPVNHISQESAVEDTVELTIPCQSSETVHGRPVSVICSTVETPKSEPDEQTAVLDAEYHLSPTDHDDETFNKVEAATEPQQLENKQSTVNPISVSVIVSDLHSQDVASNSEHQCSDVAANTEEVNLVEPIFTAECEDIPIHEDSELTMKAESEAADPPKYSGPTPPHQLLNTLDLEPTENGSSTSTDSGVVTGSPKSDICPTPPSGISPMLSLFIEKTVSLTFPSGMNKILFIKVCKVTNRSSSIHSKFYSTKKVVF